MDLKPLVRYIIRVVYPGTLLLILWEVSEVPAQSDMTIQALPGDELIPYAAFDTGSGGRIRMVAQQSDSRSDVSEVIQSSLCE
jgi:hypothetical protein